MRKLLGKLKGLVSKRKQRDWFSLSLGDGVLFLCYQARDDVISLEIPIQSEEDLRPALDEAIGELFYKNLQRPIIGDPESQLEGTPLPRADHLYVLKELRRQNHLYNLRQPSLG